MGWGTQTREARGRRRLSAPLAGHPTLGAALLLALPVVIYLWPALLGGKVFSPDAVLYKLTPWRGLQPANVASYENYLLADVPIVLRPWRELVRAMLHDGVLPLWNPHALTGVPLIGNPQTGLFSPFALPLWILPFGWALGFAAALKLWVGALGAYLLARELRLGFLPGLLAGVAFAFSSQNVMWLAPEIVPAVAVLLPWMLWLIERLLRGGGSGNAVALACVTAAALGGGHPGTQVHVLVAAGLYALLRAAIGRERAPPSRRAQLRPLALALGGLAVGVALMGALMLPEILSSHDTVGTLARKGGHGTMPGLDHMPFGAIRTPLFPDWWGRPSGFETPGSPLHTGNVNYQERTFYAGVVALLLAAIGFTNRSALRRQAPLAILGALGLAIALHAPGLWWLASHLPALNLVENQRLHFVFELAVALLAAFGLQAVLERRERSRQLAVPLIALGVGAIAAVTSGASAADAERVVRHFATGRDFARTGVTELTAVAWFLLFALGTLAALVVVRARPHRRMAVAGALLLLAALDAFHFAHGYNPMAPAHAVPPQRTPAIAYLQRHRAEGRVAGVGLALPPEVAIRYDLADVRGYDPPFPTRRFLALWRAASPTQESWLPTTFGQLAPAALQVTGALGARFIIADAGTPPTAAEGDPALSGLERVYAGRDATIFRNARAAPRAFVPARVEVVPDAATANATLADSGFDASREVVVERDQPGANVLATSGAVDGTARIAAERNAGVTLHATLDRPGVVVLADQLLDGWSVQVDGRPATPLHVNGVLRGVAVGAGTHTVQWSYRVPGLRAGAALSAAAALLLLAVLLLPRLRRLRDTRARR
jgi:hypothetical protein